MQICALAKLIYDSCTCDIIWDIGIIRTSTVLKTMENRVWEKIDTEVSKIKQGMPSSTKILEVITKIVIII